MNNDALSGLDDLSDLKNPRKQPYLLDTIDYDVDIRPHPFIKIYAGVGSGKNYFVDALARGYSDPNKNGHVQRFPQQTILLITSRRSKVNESLNDKSIKKDRWLCQWDNARSYAYDDLDDFEDALNHMRTINCCNDPLGGGTATIYQRFLPCTNAAIESYLRKWYTPNDPTTHLWNRFDIIVFDEAHAVQSDANYQTAPYFTMRLLQETYIANQQGLTNCKVIIMTGTPSILRDFKFPRQQHLIDRMQNCVHVVPKEIIFVDREQSRNIAQKMLNDGKCAVFFFNRTRELISFYNTIKKKYPLLIARVAVSFSDEEKRKAYSKSNKEDFARMEETEKYLAAHQKLPDRIRLFLTTERNKEGINIKNPDVRTMFVESHAECSVVQMAGRLREGIDKLYVVTDAIPHNDTESKFEWTTTNDGEIIEYYNQELQALLRKYELDPTELFGCAPQQDERISSYISFVEEKNPYILFDPFAMEFRLYKERYKSKQYYEQQNKIFEEAKSDPQKLCSLVRSWYPYAEISVIYSLKTQITQYLEQNDLLNREIDYSEQQRLLSYINDLTGENREKLGPALKAFGYAFAPKNKHKWCVGTIQLNDQV